MYREAYRRHFLEEEANAGTGSGTGGSGGGTAAPGGAGNGTASPSTSVTTAPAAGAGNGGAGTGTGAGVGTTVTPPANGGSWMDSLPAEIKGDPSIQLFKDSGVSGLAKSWVSAQAMLGKDKVVIPGEKATNEEWAAFHSKLGRPESPDKYDIKLPADQKLDDNFAKGFREVAFKSGMTPKQVQQAVEWYAKEAGGAVEAQQSAKQVELKQSIDAYRESLGGDDKLKARIDQARQAVRVLSDAKLNDFLDKSGAGSRPEMIEFFAKLSTMMGEDKLRDGTGVGFGEDPANIQKEITEAEFSLRSRVDSMPKFEVQAQVEKISKLYERLEASRAPRQ